MGRVVKNSAGHKTTLAEYSAALAGNPNRLEALTGTKLSP